MPGTPRPARTAVTAALSCLAAVLTTVVVAPALAAPAAAAEPSSGRVWTHTSARPAASGGLTPSAYRSYDVDPGALVAAADRGTVSLPDPDGRLRTFRVVETPVLEPALAARHPELRTWTGTSVDGAATVSLEAGPAGVHAAVLGDGPGWYVDPVSRAANAADGPHLSYRAKDLPEPQRALVEPELSQAQQERAEARADELQQAQEQAQEPEQAAGTAARPGSPTTVRTYRLALLSDPSYAAAVAPNPTSNADSDARVLAAKTTLVNRLNQLYGAELAIRFTLAEATDTALNLWTGAEATGANGPCGGVACFTTAQLTSCTDDTLARQRWVIGQLVGSRNYDVGHLALGRSGGGLGALGVVGLDGFNSKAGGCTGLPSPVGDAYAVDYLAHELGHQFGASHTYDGCSGTGDPSTAVEPGSGSTIMAYAGLCGTDDLQRQSDPTFSFASRDQIRSYVTNGPGPVPAIVREVQSVSLRDFDGTDAFLLRWPDGRQTGVLTRGSTYSASAVGSAVRAAGFSLDRVSPYFTTDIAAITDTGFSLVYPYGTGNVAEPTVVPVGGALSAVVNDIDQGTDGRTLTTGGAVSAPSGTGPTVTAPAARTIPVRTPFELTGSGSDPDGDTVRYLWEQTDAGGSGSRPLTVQPKTTGPLFRVFGTPSDSYANAPSLRATRSFPDTTQVLSGDTNAATGSCPGTPSRDCLSEWLPTAAYAGSALSFRLTGFDGSPQGGGVTSDGVTLTLDRSAGPLLVTSQAAAGAVLTGGSTQEVRWAVNGTAATGLAPRVRILLSTDGGASWPTVLAATTPNDGSETVTLPAQPAGSARLRVEAVDNYFYAVNAAPFAIAAPSDPTPSDPDPRLTVVTAPPAQVPVEYADRPVASFSVSSDAGPSGLAATATGLPAGLSLGRSVSGSTVTWTLAGAVQDAPGSYPVAVTVGDGRTSLPLATTVVVSPEDAVLSWTGDVTVTAPDRTSGGVIVTLRADVAEEPDGSPGSLAGARVSFVAGSSVLCSVLVEPTGAGAGRATCAHRVALSGAEAASLDVTTTLGGTHRGTGAATRVTVRLPEAPPSTPPSTPVTPVPTPTPTPTPTPVEPSTALSGPAGWWPSRSASFALGGGARYDCRLDGQPVGCGAGSLALAGLASGTHRVTVAAEDATGLGDRTPEVRELTVPVDDAELGGSRWRRRAVSSAYDRTLSETSRPGATLSYPVVGARRLALLVRTGEDQGKVRVYLGGRLLDTVRTAGGGGARLVEVWASEVPRSGTVRVVATSRDRVRVDGLGVWTGP